MKTIHAGTMDRDFIAHEFECMEILMYESYLLLPTKYQSTL
jgi:hypothetical protein